MTSIYLNLLSEKESEITELHYEVNHKGFICLFKTHRDWQDMEWTEQDMAKILKRAAIIDRIEIVGNYARMFKSSIRLALTEGGKMVHCKVYDACSLEDIVANEVCPALVKRMIAIRLVKKDFATVVRGEILKAFNYFDDLRDKIKEVKDKLKGKVLSM